MKSLLPETFSVVGAGRVASVLSRGLIDAGLRLDTILSRTDESAGRLAHQFGSVRSGAVDSAAVLSGELVLIAVSDDQLSEVCNQLSGLTENWDGRSIMHTSGTWSAAVLDSFQDAGALTASFHPVQTFADESPPDDAADLLKGIPVGIEGSSSGTAVAMELAKKLGCRPFLLEADSKALFHTGAVFASNYLVTLQVLAAELAATATGNDTEKVTYYQALAERALSNTSRLGAENALTGPIQRGDTRVVLQHLEALKENMPHLIPVYIALATETVRFSAAAHRLDPDTANDLLQLLSEYL